MNSLVGETWRRKDKIAKERFEGRVKKCNKDVRALAGSTEEGTNIIRDLMLKNGRSS
jgi:hypothetical protein